jgi:hypothetical protein
MGHEYDTEALRNFRSLSAGTTSRQHRVEKRQGNASANAAQQPPA